MIPILGARTVEQLKDNIGALDVELSDEHLQRLDAVSAIDLGFPHEFTTRESIRELVQSSKFRDIINHRE
jgi:diketogulonate reductase-like aldo/keto reductase